MKIAMIISGRVTNYEKCLLPILKKCKYNIDLFISVNDTNKQYYDDLKIKLSKWLKKINIEVYNIPSTFIDVYKEDPIRLQNINGKKLPLHCLSMYYNDNKAFNMSLEYSQQNNFEYDIFMKIRADVHNCQIPELIKNNNLNCIKPRVFFLTHGIHKQMCVSDCFTWGTKQIMTIYFNTYEFTLNKNIELNGKYWVAFEDCLTDIIYEHNIPVKYYKHKYDIIQKTNQPL